MKGEFVDLGGVGLYCHAAGSRGAGAPIVLLHGFPTSSRIWTPVVSRIAPGHRLLLLDLLGFGRSDPPAGHDVSIAGHATRLLALLDQLGVRDAVLAGHDIGALVAWRLARMAPERVRGLVLLNPASREALPRAFKLGPLARRAPGALRRAALARSLRRGWHHEPQAGRAAESRAFVRGLTAAALDRHLADLPQSATDPLLDPATWPAVPVALAAGGLDPWGGATNARRLADGNSGASCRIFEDAGHFLTYDAPEGVADLLHEIGAQ